MTRFDGVAVQATLLALLMLTPAFSQSTHTDLLPKETVAAFSVLDGQQWQQNWQETSLSKFFDNPAIQRYLSSITRGASSDAVWLQLILPGDRPVKVSGQFTYALIGTGTGLDHLIQLDCADQTAATNWVDAISKRFTDQKFQQQSGSEPLRVFQSQNGTTQFAVMAMGKRGLACTNPAILKQLLSGEFKSLSGTAEFRTTVDQSAQQTANSLFWWFVRPIELTLGNPADKKAVDNYRMLKAQGFGNIKALGGTGTIDQKRFTSTGFASIEQPLQRAARIVDFRDSDVPPMPTWCHAATSCGFFNLRTDQFLENYSSLFDALYGEGESGVFEAVLSDLKQRKDGPQVDLQGELVQFLEQRVFFATVQGQSSAPKIIAIPTTDSKRVAAAVRKLFDGDSRAKEQSNANQQTWKIMPLDDGYGIKEPFVISIREGAMFLAPNKKVLDYLSQNGSGGGSFQPSDVPVKLGYRVDMEQFAERVFGQLNARQFPASTESLLDQLKLKKPIMAADPSKLPGFESVRSNFDFVFHLVGVGSESGWKLQIETR